VEFSDVDVVSVRCSECLITTSTEEVPFHISIIFHEQIRHLITNQVLYGFMDEYFLGLLFLGLFLTLGRLYYLSLYLLGPFLWYVTQNEVRRLSIFESLADL
jgi:hypothetical protein